MQLSNGLADPVGLWLGHLLFDSVFVVLLSTIIIIIFAAVAGNRFFGLGFFVSQYMHVNSMLLTLLKCSGLSLFYMELLEHYSLTAFP